jgi:cytochrome c biogenesis protein CcmG/thiol:disulfide interchange protein DsbE
MKRRLLPLLYPRKNPAFLFFLQDAMTRSSIILGSFFIGAVLLAVTVFAALQAMKTPEGPKPIAERTPMAISHPTLDGGNWSMADHPGQVILVNYFATWCPPCREEMPDLKRIFSEYEKKGVRFAAVSLDQDTDSGRPRADVLTKYNASEKLPFPILTPDPNSPLFRNPFPIPQTLLIDRNGKVALHVTGMINAKQITTTLDTLLAETATTTSTAPATTQ